MAARRLVVVMIVLLAISTLAAALIPPPRAPHQTTTRKQRQPPKPPPPRPSSGALVKARFDAGSPQPGEVRVHPGDELSLQVSAPRAGVVEIPAFGLLKAVDPLVPASFDFIVDRAGTFPVQLLSSGQTAGRIVSAPPAAVWP